MAFKKDANCSVELCWPVAPSESVFDDDEDVLCPVLTAPVFFVAPVCFRVAGGEYFVNICNVLRARKNTENVRIVV